METKIIYITVVLCFYLAECTPVPEDLKKSNDKLKGNICTSPICVKSAATIIRNMDTSVDPCEDFYSFVCGGFIKKNVIEDHRSSIDQFMLVTDEIHRKLRMALEQPITDKDIHPFVLAKTFYQSCMNEERIEDIGLNDTKAFLKSLGGWPVLEDDWKDDNFTWYDTIFRFRKAGLGINYLFNFAIKTNIQNSTHRIISFDQPGLGLDRKHLIQGLDNPEVQAYYEYIVDIATSLGADKERAKMELLDSLNFEISLANISKPMEERRMPLSLSGPIWYAEKKFAAIPWLEYINSILSPVSKVEDDEIISIKALDFTGNFSALINNTSKRTIANYLFRRAVASMVRYLPVDIRNHQQDFTRKYLGVSTRTPRWEECIQVMDRSLPVVLGAIYVRHYFSEEGRLEAKQMVDNIIAQFISDIDKLDWMDEETRNNAKEKSKSTLPIMAYPDELLDDKILTEYFQELYMDPKEYRKNVLNLNLFTANKRISNLHNPITRVDWILQGAAATVNSFYNYGKNVIEFPAGILQGIFFNKDRPKYLNYGAIGYAIGHEVTHGFDDTGRRINAEGNLINWWDNSTAMKFLDRTMCFIEQYGSINVPELNITLNGINSQGEIIADNGGLKSSYKAYLNLEKQTGSEPLLPGLPYNAHQLFWISYGNTGCEKYRFKALKQRVLSSYHPPYRYRVNGAVSNTDFFVKDFNCPVGSKMNLQNKCSIWR